MSGYYGARCRVHGRDCPGHRPTCRPPSAVEDRGARSTESDALTVTIGDMRTMFPDDDDHDAELIEQRLRAVTENEAGFAHTGARQTELDAALKIMGRTGNLRQRALLAIARVFPDGMSDAELADDTGVYLYSIAPRRVELLRAELVEDSGITRAHGRHDAGTVWRATALGRAVAERLRDK